MPRSLEPPRALKWHPDTLGRLVRPEGHLANAVVVQVDGEGAQAPPEDSAMPWHWAVPDFRRPGRCHLGWTLARGVPLRPHPETDTWSRELVQYLAQVGADLAALYGGRDVTAESYANPGHPANGATVHEYRPAGHLRWIQPQAARQRWRAQQRFPAALSAAGLILTEGRKARTDDAERLGAELLKLRDDRWTSAEIGARYGLTAGAVDSRLSRARKRLAERSED